jgi:hypothetical protein
VRPHDLADYDRLHRAGEHPSNDDEHNP